MKLLYPASNNLSHLNDLSTSIKIARHSPCTACESCPGLHPPPTFDLVRDDKSSKNSLVDLAQYGSDDDDGMATYLLSCDCGHSVKDHGADETAVDQAEYARRARVAVKIDEHLENAGRLLDFEYSDEDMDSLRHQMRIPVSFVTSLTEVITSPEKPPPSSGSSHVSERISQPPAKRRRVSLSSLSDAEDDEEDRPLAARMASHSSHKRPPENGARQHDRRGGKKTSRKENKAHTAPMSLAPPTGELQAEMNGEISPMNGHAQIVKVEERMDEGQLDRLVTGVTVDTEGGPASAPPIKPEKPSAVELRKGVIQIIPVENDGQPRSLVILTNLKTLFQKQLPVMPADYIARLVFDSNSKALAICKRGYKVVGGICYRPFPHRGFAEIVFFATASVDQEKGYGGLLMDHFKAHIRRTYPEMMHFLTYADNYAVGYFKKQGFTKDISLDRSVWAGYIKDYEGGTIMQCTLLRRVDYLAIRDVLTAQREAILSKIRQMSKSHIVYEGLPQFQNGQGDGEGVYVDPKDVPGLRESGWTPAMMTTNGVPSKKNAERAAMERILSELQNNPSAWPFMQPVNASEVPDYYEIIKSPMDFSTMEHKLENGQYPDLDAFLADARLVFDNCRLFNQEDSIYWKNANKIEKHMDEIVARLRE
ncbi:Bromodomain-containing protein [Dentipellis sp. KUC8613]|nr:Bromodomain-containing protein [Dentipellis sp. KUC8613]